MKLYTTINEFKEYLTNESLNNTIVYHGTDKEFTNFKLFNDVSNPTYGNVIDNNLGIFFTDNIIMAKWFAKLIDFDINTGKYENTNNTGRIISAKLNIKRPYILQEQIEEIDPDDPGQTYFNLVEEYGGGKKMREKLIQEGFDGVIVKNMNTNYYEDGDYNLYVVFDPKQIKIINIEEI